MDGLVGTMGELSSGSQTNNGFEHANAHVPKRRPSGTVPEVPLVLSRIPLRATAEERSDPPTITVIIPTLNEAENIGHVLARVPAWVDEIIVVDGNSTDGTPEIAATARDGVTIIFQTGSGKGNGIACGMAAAAGDIVVLLDADGSTDPAEIPRFVAALRTGADFAKGTRFAMGGGSADITRIRRIGNRALGLFVNRLWQVQYTDLCYGYNAFWRSCLPDIFVDCNGFEVETLINIKAARRGLRVVEVPSYEATRFSGSSNLSARRDGLRILRTILAERLRPS
jgi:glycosyltransferase involved in cell wall biosynthesis